MAQAIALAITEEGVAGDSMGYSSRVQFLGTDLPNGPDAATVHFTIDPGDTPATIRDKFANAIKAEATRLGYSLPNNRIVMPAYVKV
jgi:hypothetical protein